jgi:enamine deaminase RidA (YjgF/YER057c/UK114 family)
MSGPHRLVNPAGMPPAAGFSHAAIAGPGTTVAIAGQIAANLNGAVVGESFAEQFEVALTNVVIALRGAGAAPEHVVSLVMYTTDMEGYRASLREVGAAYRARFGRHFPAMVLVGVTALVEPSATVEIAATAVIPHPVIPD